MKNRFQITEYCHSLVKAFGPADVRLCIDATMGNGGDTVFLAELAGEEGHVLAFDVQEAALEATKAALAGKSPAPGVMNPEAETPGPAAEVINPAGGAAPLSDRVELILDGHENMDRYAAPESVDVIMFNFGYLPGGDHSVSTKAETSVAAVEKGLGLLKKGGIMSLCIYSGGDTGFDEMEALMDFLRTVDGKRFVVIGHEYINRENNPPKPVIVVKVKSEK